MLPPGNPIGAPASDFHPLSILLARYPKLNAPGITNVSMRHMQGMAKRANTSAVHGSVLRDFLAGV